MDTSVLRFAIPITALVASAALVLAPNAVAAPDTAPPVVSDVSLPEGGSGPSLTASAKIVDELSGINKAYLYIDTPAGKNATGIRLWDDATHGDATSNDDRYSANSDLSLPNGTYVVSVLTYDSKYNETKPKVADLMVNGASYTWVPTSGVAPTPTAMPTPTPTPPPPASSPDTSPPSVTGVAIPTGTTGSTITASAVITDVQSGINKAYLYIDTPAGKNVTGIRLLDDGTGGDATRNDGRYSATTMLTLPDGIYAISVLTYDSKYNETKPLVAGLTVDGNNYNWSTGVPTPTPTPTSTPTATPTPTGEPTMPPAPPPAGLPGLPMLGGPMTNLVTNGDFANGTTNWVLTDGVGVVSEDGGPVIAVPSGPITSRAIQEIVPLLAPDTTYTLTARARSTSTGATLEYANKDGSISGKINVPQGGWQNLSTTFTTGNRYVGGKLTAEYYKGNTGILYLDDITLLAQGGEWLDTPNPYPVPKPALFDDFDGTHLDKDKWLIANKGWGGDNGGVVPENVSLGGGTLRLNANGDQYSGNVLGVGGKRKTRVGAVVVSRDYYASGKYEVRARIPQTLGASTAFWTFHYMEYQPNQAEYIPGANQIRNSEIDWEFPTSINSSTPISYDNARANAWGAKRPGDGGETSLRADVSRWADGQFHTYRFDWHAGSGTDIPYIEWSVDGTSVARIDGVAGGGVDNIPFRASRFWVGIWFPAAGYLDKVGWAGNPNFDQIHLDIDWVKITPFYETNDKYEAETWPNGFYATPDQYP